MDLSPGFSHMMFCSRPSQQPRSCREHREEQGMHQCIPEFHITNIVLLLSLPLAQSKVVELLKNWSFFFPGRLYEKEIFQHDWAQPSIMNVSCLTYNAYTKVRVMSYFIEREFIQPEAYSK